MPLLVFELSGDMAMWRNVYESMGSFSCLGPAPSNLAGLCGAALGFASIRSQGVGAPDVKILKAQQKKGIFWPVADELLQWEEKNDVCFACRWIGGFPVRIPWNVNGVKEIGKGENLRLQQQVIEKPCYEVAVQVLLSSELDHLAKALIQPAFPLCLGASFCRAIVRKVRICNDLPEGGNWAFRSTSGSLGEVVPFSQHVVNYEECRERIQSDGYWVYPTPDNPGINQHWPLEKCYVRIMNQSV